MASVRSAAWWRWDVSAVAMDVRRAPRLVAFRLADSLLGAGKADLRVRAVAEGLLGRAATAAQRDRVAGQVELVTVGVDEAHGALHEVRTVEAGLDRRLVHMALLRACPGVPGAVRVRAWGNYGRPVNWTGGDPKRVPEGQRTRAPRPPTNAPPATSQAELRRVVRRRAAAATARPAVSQSTTAARPSCQVTAVIKATDAAFAPSRNPAAQGDRRSRGISGFERATNTNDGRKMAVVA